MIVNTSPASTVVAAEKAVTCACPVERTRVTEPAAFLPSAIGVQGCENGNFCPAEKLVAVGAVQEIVCAPPRASGIVGLAVMFVKS